MKNVQILLMIFSLSLLLLSLSQSILQTMSPPNYSLHFKHTHTVMFNHILTSQICTITVSLCATGVLHPTAILGWRQATWSSTTLSYQSCIECYNSKLCQYRMILGCQLFKFEN